MEKVLVIVPPGGGGRELRATLRSLQTQRQGATSIVVAQGWFDSGQVPEGMAVTLEKAGGKVEAWVAEVITRHPGFAVMFAPRGQLCRAEKIVGALAALEVTGAGWLSHAAHDGTRDYLADARVRARPLAGVADWGRVVLGPEVAAAWAGELRKGAKFLPEEFIKWAGANGRKGAEMREGWQVMPSRECRLPIPEDLALTLFAAKARGRRGFVIGNGPSLRRMDLGKLATEVTGASNGFYRMFPEINWRPTFYTCVDTQVLPDQAAALAGARRDAPETDWFFPQEVVDDETWKLRWSVPTLIPPDGRTCYFPQVPAFWTEDPFDAWPRDPSDGLYAAQTVTVTLLQLAVLYGCNPIYLIGCDHRYQVPGTVREAPVLGGGPAVLCSTADDDPNHFSPEYFGKGRKWHQPNLAGMERHYLAARKAAKKLGVEILNAGVESKLEVFPRVRFEELF